MHIARWMDLLATWVALALMVLEVRAIRSGRRRPSVWPIVWFVAAAAFTALWLLGQTR